jgi:hypothetical protein
MTCVIDSTPLRIISIELELSLTSVVMRCIFAP